MQHQCSHTINDENAAKNTGCKSFCKRIFWGLILFLYIKEKKRQLTYISLKFPSLKGNFTNNTVYIIQ